MRKSFVLTVAVLALGGVFVGGPAMAEEKGDTDALKTEAKTIIMAFAKSLKGKLKDAMDEGGPLKAVSVCNQEADGIAKTYSKDGWFVGRTSAKNRNTGNAPDAWETATLGQWEEKIAAGANPADLARAEIVEENGKKTFRFMKAIPVQGVCLNCHGAEIKPELAQSLDKFYPADKARGYHEGELRGAFTLKKVL